MSEPRITYDPTDGLLDELIANNCHIHLERLDHATWWIGLTLPDGTRIDLDLGVTPFARERHVTTTPEGDTR